MLQSINQKATAVMNTLTDGLSTPGDAKKFDKHDYATKGRGVMAVSVECVDEVPHGKIFSVTHYYEQEGDLMSDPDMTFLRVKSGNYIPMTYRQDNLGIHQQAVWCDGPQREQVKFYPKMQKDITAFANLWMKNIKDQQDLSGLSASSPCYPRRG